MLNRHVMLPLLVVGVIGVPALIFESDIFRADPQATGPQESQQQNMLQPYGNSGYATNSVPVNLSPQQLIAPMPNSVNRFGNSPVASSNQVPMRMASAQINRPGTGGGYSGGIANSTGSGQLGNSNGYTVPGGTLQGQNLHPSQLSPSAIPFSSNQGVGGVQTLILPGDANGPNLSATPMEFMPTSRLGDVFRFDVYPDWVKARWTRVSTAATDFGLHGLRVALVTGVNPGDLHGSLTYYFDDEQKVQRISFRGWTGDATRLVELVTKEFGLKPQQTHMTGLYLVKHRRNITGALLMQHPTVVRAQSPTQKVAVSMEINRPNGPFILSHEIASLLPRAQSQ